MKVYRIENSKGEGPYRTKQPLSWLKGTSCNQRPAPDNDGKNLSSLMQESNFEEYLCGFKSLDQLFDWFTPQDIKKLLDSGFKIVEMKVHKKFVKIGSSQIMFHKIAIEDCDAEWNKFKELRKTKKFKKYLSKIG